ncbi:MAG: insulinase family protein [Synechococcales cyanobacterium RM1_1_8]|nr:insulinase family protein [Synechococcales cyanobacterium RM1_1_8]
MIQALLRTPAPRLNQPTVFKLPCGLTLIAEQMPIDVVTLDIWARVGSAMEPDEINGMAHFLEHMVFKGTERLKAGEFEQRVEARGASMNAATSQDYTHFYITTAPKDFEELAPLQLDLVFNPLIPDPDFEPERQVVLEEILRSEDNPQRRGYRHMIESCFERLPYRRQVLGPAAVVETVTPAQMREFHARWYRPENLTIVAVGNLPVETLRRTVEAAIPEHFKTAQTNPAPHSSPSLPPSALLPEPPLQQVQRHEFTDPALQQTRMSMSWRVPGLQHIDDTYSLDVLASILSQGRTSRLVQDLREQRSLVTSVSASNADYWAQGLFTISTRLEAENLEAVEALIVEHLHRLRNTPVTEAEISRVRTQVANRFVFGNERPSDRAGLYGYYQTLMGDLEPAFNYPEIIRSITAEDLQEAALRYLNPEAYTFVVIRPEAK